MANSSFDQQYYSLLASRIREGDSDAFAELYGATYDTMYRRVCSLLHDPDDVHDALQEIYMSVYENIGNLRLDRLLVPWMRQIAYHICCDMLRRDLPRRERTVDLSDNTLPPQSADHSLRQVYDRDTWDRVTGILSRLPVRAQQAFTLRYEFGMKLEEIAGAMGISPASVKRYINMARAALQTEFVN